MAYQIVSASSKKEGPMLKASEGAVVVDVPQEGGVFPNIGRGFSTVVDGRFVQVGQPPTVEDPALLKRELMPEEKREGLDIVDELAELGVQRQHKGNSYEVVKHNKLVAEEQRALAVKARARGIPVRVEDTGLISGL